MPVQCPMEKCNWIGEADLYEVDLCYTPTGVQSQVSGMQLHVYSNTRVNIPGMRH